MRITATEFITLDGVFEEPRWTLDYFDPQLGDFKNAELFAADALLFGRVTYEGFAAAWPGRTDDDGYADYLNGAPKYVVSNTLERGDWQNTTVLRGADVLAQVAALRAQPGRDLLIFGSGTLVNSLIAAGLLDELNLQIFPLVVGRGRQLYQPDLTNQMALIDAATTSRGVIIAKYRPLANPSA